MIHLKISLIALLFFSLYNCSQPNTKTTKIIKNLYNRKISLTLDNADSSIFQNSKILIYIDSTDCNACKVRNLIFWQETIDEYQTLDENIHFIFLIFPKKEALPEVLAMVDEIGYKNVFIDMEREFMTQNTFLPANNFFHVFLLDSTNKIKLIGSPLNNKKMNKLYKKEIKKLRKKTNFNL